jgi:hypothetical protein
VEVQVCAEVVGPGTVDDGVVGVVPDQQRRGSRGHHQLVTAQDHFAMQMPHKIDLGSELLLRHILII